jgi:hypothetical protein
MKYTLPRGYDKDMHALDLAGMQEFPRFCYYLTIGKIPLRPITALWPPLKEHIVFILKGQADQEKHSESNAQGCK